MSIPCPQCQQIGKTLRAIELNISPRIRHPGPHARVGLSGSCQTPSNSSFVLAEGFAGTGTLVIPNV